MRDGRRNRHPGFEVRRRSQPTPNGNGGGDEENDAERKDEASARHGVSGGNRMMNARTIAGVDPGEKMRAAHSKSMESNFASRDLEPQSTQRTQRSML
jgi:hypothetical protein